MTVGTRQNATKILALPAIMSLRILLFYEKLPALNALLKNLQLIYFTTTTGLDVMQLIHTIFVFFVRIIM